MKLFLIFVINLVSCLVYASEVIEFVAVNVEKLHDIDSVLVCTSAKINSGFEIKDLNQFLLLEVIGQVLFEDWKKNGYFKTHEYYRQMERYKDEYSHWDRLFEDEFIQKTARDMKDSLKEEYDAFILEHRRCSQKSRIV